MTERFSLMRARAVDINILTYAEMVKEVEEISESTPFRDLDRRYEPEAEVKFRQIR